MTKPSQNSSPQKSRLEKNWKKTSFTQQPFISQRQRGPLGKILWKAIIPKPLSSRPNTVGKKNKVHPRHQLVQVSWLSSGGDVLKSRGLRESTQREHRANCVRKSPVCCCGKLMVKSRRSAQTIEISSTFGLIDKSRRASGKMLRRPQDTTFWLHCGLCGRLYLPVDFSILQAVENSNKLKTPFRLQVDIMNVEQTP